MQFSIKTALECAAWCEFSYGLPTHPAHNQYEIRALDSSATDIHGKFILLPGKNLLVFEGTHSFGNFFNTDAAVTMETWGPAGIQVHHGALQAYLSIQDQLIETLEYAPVAPLTIAGHSLGAWLCCLAAWDLVNYEKSKHPVCDVYPIACPKWTNRFGSRLYDASLGAITWRITHSLDPVPHLPCFAPGMPVWSHLYWATRQHAWIDDAGHLDLNRSLWKELPRAIICGFNELARGEETPMPDHGIARYMQALQRVQLNASAQSS